MNPSEPSTTVENNEAVAIVPENTPTLFGSDPALALTRIEELAKIVRAHLERNGMVSTLRFSGREQKHVRIEGWTFVGGLVGVFPVTLKTQRLDLDGVVGWEATVAARTRDGATVGTADGMCMKSEPRWKTAEEYAIRSMAQTRAASKALSQALRFLVTMAGYEGTPAEEMDSVEPFPSTPVSTAPAPTGTYTAPAPAATTEVKLVSPRQKDLIEKLASEKLDVTIDGSLDEMLEDVLAVKESLPQLTSKQASTIISHLLGLPTHA